MKKNIVIIILSIMLLGTTGYLIYDKFLSLNKSLEKKENENENNLNKPNSNPTILGIDDFKSYDGSYGFVDNITFHED